MFGRKLICKEATLWTCIQIMGRDISKAFEVTVLEVPCVEMKFLLAKHGMVVVGDQGCRHNIWRIDD